jgi:hypothetical protein
MDLLDLGLRLRGQSLSFLAGGFLHLIPLPFSLHVHLAHLPLGLPHESLVRLIVNFHESVILGQLMKLVVKFAVLLRQIQLRIRLELLPDAVLLTIVLEFLKNLTKFFVEIHALGLLKIHLRMHFNNFVDTL